MVQLSAITIARGFIVYVHGIIIGNASGAQRGTVLMCTF
jgi:hypothetical protein